MDKIIFHNQPKFSPHEVDSKFNERRNNLIPQVENFILNHPRFKDQEVGVTFSHKGVSSLICIIETEKEKLILKIPLRIAFSAGEGQFLKIWEQNGVKVPHVFEEGTIGEHSYTLMEFIDAPNLADVYNNEELIEKGIYFEMGMTLRKMHEPEAEGYGRVVDGKGEYSEFQEWLLGEDMKKRFQEVQEKKLLGEEHGSLARACEILLKHVEDKKSSYCHDDFGTTNIFATEPITVFDPSPMFNDRYMDLGRSLFNRIALNLFSEEFIDGYFQNEVCDQKVLHAAILINTYYKFPYALKTNKTKLIENMQVYLIKNKHLLDS